MTKAPLDPAATIVSVLAACRRRHRFVLVGQYGLVVGVALIASALTLFIVLPVGVAAWNMTFLTFIASVVILSLAHARTSSIRRVAQHVDAKLALEDRLLTAYQHLSDADVFSRLVLRDAAARVSAVRPADVFPFRVPPRLRAVCACAVAAAISVCVVLTIVGGREMRRHAVARSEGMAQTSASSSSSSDSRRPAPDADTVAPSADAPPASSSSADRTIERPRDGGTSAAGQSDGVTRDASPALRREGPRGDSNAAPGASPVSREPADRSPSTSQESTSRVPVAVSGRTDASEAGPGSAASARVGSGSASDGSPLPAGEIRGSPAAITSADRAAAPRGPEYAARYRTSAARAESALADERIPPGLRAYVKAYFIAIRPEH